MTRHITMKKCAVIILCNGHYDILNKLSYLFEELGIKENLKNIKDKQYSETEHKLIDIPLHITVRSVLKKKNNHTDRYSSESNTIKMLCYYAYSTQEYEEIKAKHSGVIKAIITEMNKITNVPTGNAWFSWFNSYNTNRDTANAFNQMLEYYRSAIQEYGNQSVSYELFLLQSTLITKV
jgi:hypothetical protein